MLSPLHWHDYKKQYGKLDDFVASHPEVRFLRGLVNMFLIIMYIISIRKTCTVFFSCL